MRGVSVPLVLVCTLAGAKTAAAKPRTVHVDPILKKAWLVAEAEIVKVTQPNPAGGWAATGGVIRIRVTRDPRRVYRGWEHLGREIDLVPIVAGSRLCASDMETRRRMKKSVLVFADADKTLWFAGDPSTDRTHAIVRSWFDWNACWLRIDDKRLCTAGGRPGRLARFEIPTLAAYYATDARRFWARVAPILAGRTKPIPKGRMAILVARLGSASAELRRAAHAELVRSGRHSIVELRRARARQTDPETKRRLNAVLQALLPEQRAVDVAALLTGQPEEQRKWVIAHAPAPADPGVKAAGG